MPANYSIIRIKLFAIFILVFLLIPGANAHHTGLDLRQSYVEAEKLLKKRHLSAWRKIKPKLKDYPLYPYLQLREIQVTNSSEYTNSEISELLTATGIHPPPFFTIWWINKLGKAKQWELLTKHFENYKNTQVQCAYTLALIQSKQLAKATPRLEKLWLTGRSRPKYCDPLFNYSLKHGLIDDRLVWQRIMLTQARKNDGMTRYLQRKLKSKKAKQWVKILKSAHRNPRDELRVHISEWSKSDYGIDVIHYAFTRIVKRSLNESIQVWNELKKKHPEVFPKLAKTQQKIGSRMALNHHVDTYKWLSTLPDHMQTTDNLRLRVRSALASESWQHVLDTINLMDADEADGSEWIFWKARALHELGETEKANDLWLSIASEVSFFGFLAADQLQMDYQLQPTETKFLSDQQIEEITSNVPGFLRVREWVALDRMYSARRELHSMRDIKDDLFWQAAANMFVNWKWHDGAIRTSYRLEQPSQVALNVFYPTPFSESVRKESNRYGVPQHWIYSIIRQESHFIPDIRSHMGATGLMQLLPSTARSTARKQGIKSPSTSQLTHASLNIRLGVAYFKQLLKQMNSNPVFALAGYNAGPSRSRRWQKRFRASDPAIWVETIPFKETRIYVKNILTNFVVYDTLYNLNEPKLRDYLKAPDFQHATN